MRTGAFKYSSLGLALLAFVFLTIQFGVHKAPATDGSSASQNEPNTRNSVTSRRTVNASATENATLAVSNDTDETPDSDQSDEDMENALGKIDPNELLRRATELANDDKASEQRQLMLAQWAARDPADAARRTAQIEPERLREEAMQQVAIAWANRDPRQAMEWLDQLPAGETRETALRTAAYEAARNEPLPALGIAATMEPGSERSEVLAHVVEQWAGVDAQAAAAWVMQVTEEPLREQLLRAVATTSAEGNGASAANFVAETMKPGPEQDLAAVAVAQRWAEHSVEDARAWVRQFPSATLREAAEESLRSLSN